MLNRQARVIRCEHCYAVFVTPLSDYLFLYRAPKAYVASGGLLSLNIAACVAHIAAEDDQDGYSSLASTGARTAGWSAKFAYSSASLPSRHLAEAPGPSSI